MQRLIPALLVSIILFSCTTTEPHVGEVEDNSPPHTADDVTRSFSYPLQTVLEACELALADVGADYLEPIIEVKENSASITGATESCLYGLLLLGYDDRTDIMLILDDKSSKEVIRKSVFDQFWAAVESHL